MRRLSVDAPTAGLLALGCSSALLAAPSGGWAVAGVLCVTAFAVAAASVPPIWSRRCVVAAPVVVLAGALVAGEVHRRSYPELLLGVASVAAAVVAASRIGAERAGRDALAGSDARALAEARIDDAVRTGLAAGRDTSPLAVELERCRRHGRALSVAVVRSDLLATLPEDRRPEEVAATAVALGGFLRTADAAFRIDGSDLCVLLCDTPVSEARPAAERLRLSAARSGERTVSIGVASFPLDGADDRTLLAAARDALGAAVAIGDRTVLAQTEPGDPASWRAGSTAFRPDLGAS